LLRCAAGNSFLSDGSSPLGDKMALRADGATEYLANFDMRQIIS